MPVEIIAERGTPSHEWLDAECQLAIKHLITIYGEPPMQIELEVQWQEHNLGEPTIALTWEDAMGTAWRKGRDWNRRPSPIADSSRSYLRTGEGIQVNSSWVRALLTGARVLLFDC